MNNEQEIRSLYRADQEDLRQEGQGPSDDVISGSI